MAENNVDELIQRLQALRDAGESDATKLVQNELVEQLKAATLAMQENSRELQNNLAAIKQQRETIKAEIDRKTAELDVEMRKSDTQWQSLSGIADVNSAEMAAFKEQWALDHAESSGLKNLQSTFNTLNDQVNYLERIADIPDVMELIGSKIENGNDISDEQLKSAADLLRVSRAYGEKLDDINKNIRESGESSKTIRDFWKEFPAKLGEKLSGAKGMMNQMFGSEFMNLIGKAGSISKGILQRALNPTAAVAEAKERFARMKDLVSIGPKGIASSLKEGMGLGMSGRMGDLANAYKNRMEGIRGAGPGTDLSRSTSEIEENTGTSADRLEEVARMARQGSTPGSIYTHDTHLEQLMVQKDRTERIQGIGQTKEQRNWRSFMRRNMNMAAERGEEHLKVSKLANFLSKSNLLKMLGMMGKGGILGTLLGFITKFFMFGWIKTLIGGLGIKALFGRLFRFPGMIIRGLLGGLRGGIKLIVTAITGLGRILGGLLGFGGGDSGDLDADGRRRRRRTSRRTRPGARRGIFSRAANALRNVGGSRLGTAARTGGRLIRGVGGAALKRVPLLGAALGAANIYSTFSDPNATTEQKGGAVGGATGMGIGMALGSFLGPIGTVVGGYLGEKVGSWIGEKVAPGIAKAWDGVTGALSGAWETYKQGWKDVFNGAKEGWNTLTSAVGEGWKSATGFISDTWNSVTDTIGGAWKSVSETVSKGWASLKEGAGKVVGGALSGIAQVGGNIWESVTNFFSNRKEDVTNAVQTGSVWEVVKAANPVLGMAAEGAEKVTGWFKSLFRSDKEAEIVTNNAQTAELVTSTALNTNSMETVIPATASVVSKTMAQPEGLGSKFDTLAELQEKASNVFTTGFQSLLEAIQGIRIPGPAPLPATTNNIPSDIDSLGILMTNKIWGTM